MDTELKEYCKTTKTKSAEPSLILDSSEVSALRNLLNNIRDLNQDKDIAREGYALATTLEYIFETKFDTINE